MPKRKITTASRKTPNEPKPEASYKLIAKWAETICSYGDTTHDQRTAAFLLLMDEIERSQFDRLRIDGICMETRRAAFAVSEEAGRARDRFVAELRQKSGLTLVRPASYG